MAYDSAVVGFQSAGYDLKTKRKEAEIYQALSKDPVDVAALRRMAISEGGLLRDEIRRRVWPRLLNVNTEDLPPPPGRATWLLLLGGGFWDPLSPCAGGPLPEGQCK